MVGNRRFYFIIYNGCFKGIELIAFIIPSIPSSFTVRITILSVYFTIYSMGFMNKYKLWKQSIMNQFDEKKEDSGSESEDSDFIDTPAIHKRNHVYDEENNITETVQENENHVAVNINTDIENVILHDDYIDPVDPAISIDHVDKISPGRSDSEYSFVE